MDECFTYGMTVFFSSRLIGYGHSHMLVTLNATDFCAKPFNDPSTSITLTW